MSFVRSFEWLVIGIVAFVATGCASVGGAAGQGGLEARVAAYWAARAVGDHVTAYPFEEISTKPEGSLQRYISSRGAIVYTKAEVLEVKRVSEDAAEAKVALSYRLPMPGMRNLIEAVATDHWRLIDGEWYHVTRPGVMWQQ